MRYRQRRTQNAHMRNKGVQIGIGIAVVVVSVSLLIAACILNIVMEKRVAALEACGICLPDAGTLASFFCVIWTVCITVLVFCFNFLHARVCGLTLREQKKICPFSFLIDVFLVGLSLVVLLAVVALAWNKKGVLLYLIIWTIVVFWLEICFVFMESRATVEKWLLCDIRRNFPYIRIAMEHLDFEEKEARDLIRNYFERADSELKESVELEKFPDVFYQLQDLTKIVVRQAGKKGTSLLAGCLPADYGIRHLWAMAAGILDGSKEVDMLLELFESIPYEKQDTETKLNDRVQLILFSYAYLDLLCRSTEERYLYEQMRAAFEKSGFIKECEQEAEAYRMMWEEIMSGYEEGRHRYLE